MRRHPKLKGTLKGASVPKVSFGLVRRYVKCSLRVCKLVIGKYSPPFSSTAFAVLLVIVPTFASAAILTPLFDINVRDASILKSGFGGGTHELSFVVVNEDTRRVDGVAIGLKINDKKNGETVYERVLEASSSLGPIEKQEKTFPINLSVLDGGDYQVFAVVENTDGVTLALGFAGDITINKTQTDRATVNSIKECSFSNENSSVFACSANTKSDTPPIWHIYRESIYGEELLNGDFNLEENGGYFIDTSSLGLDPGRYEISASFEDAKGEPISRVITRVFEVPGSWVSVTSYSLRNNNDGTVDVELLFDGSGTSEDRGFLLWILDVAGSVCARDTIRLSGTSPGIYRNTFSITGTCDGPVIAGVLYDGFKADGAYNVIETIGDADFSLLINELSKSSTMSMYFYIICAIIIILLSLASFFLFWVRKKGGDKTKMLPILLLFFTFTLVAPPVVSAQTFTSVHDTFTVNFDNGGVFQSGNNIAFTFGFEDRRTGLRPIGASAYVYIDDDVSSKKTLDLSANSSVFHVSLPVSVGQGAHTLTFVVAGNFYDDNNFDEARYDIDESTFTVHFVVGTGGGGGGKGCNYTAFAGKAIKQCVYGGKFGSCSSDSDCPDIRNRLISITSDGECQKSGSQYTQKFKFNIDDLNGGGEKAALLIDSDANGTYESRYPVGSNEFAEVPFETSVSSIGSSPTRSISVVLINEAGTPISFASQSVSCVGNDLHMNIDMDDMCKIGEEFSIELNAKAGRSPVAYIVDWIKAKNKSGQERKPQSGFYSPAREAVFAYTPTEFEVVEVNLRALAPDGQYTPWVREVFICTEDGSYNPVLEINAHPRLVRRGRMTNISWRTENMESCDIYSSSNRDLWLWSSKNGTLALPSGSNTTSPIREKTIYTLSCKTLLGVNVSTTTIVHIVPNVEEI